jgi:hypothetical protein
MKIRRTIRAAALLAGLPLLASACGESGPPPRPLAPPFASGSSSVVLDDGTNVFVSDPSGVIVYQKTRGGSVIELSHHDSAEWTSAIARACAPTILKVGSRDIVYAPKVSLEGGGMSFVAHYYDLQGNQLVELKTVESK